ncbi:uncharacterized protein STEHIDRAFT_158941 [Stereum hirsutum FP-91666 SS1]|uniref:uncharacterized protein n=1 Tax=Stereum hirsutum (strain FP-91666) TaxID=721885 RepID=UPI0004449E5E|nr:uncharacterized protein STEHIDRAFT_158941 [Stereum hirsutum FP-91666 SS1]EIM84254.1 hypothetical protein STEHIDRAFT_158941 [Stereum hirsutum FP-91666 SS1]
MPNQLESFQILLNAEQYWASMFDARVAVPAQISAQSNMDELNKSRQLMDEELAAMNLVMCRARIRRNALTTSCRVPPEILALCFLHLASRDIPYRAPKQISAMSSATKANIAWIKVLQVCTHWRQVALSQPSLWTRIAFCLGPRWADEMASNAKAAPLIIEEMTGNSTPQTVQCIDKIIGDHISHIKRIALVNGTTSLTGVVNRETAAPLLESLDLNALSYKREHLNDMRRCALSNIFGRQTPRLRRICLTNIQILPPTFCVLKTVTELSISFPRRGSLSSDTLPSTQSFLDMLKAAPSLEFLNLIHVLPHIHDEDTIPSKVPSVHLSHLVEMCIQGPPLDCVAVLRQVTIPRTSRLDVTCTRHLWVNFEDILFPIITAHTQGDGAPPIRTLAISRDRMGRNFELEIIAWAIERTQVEGVLEKPVFHHYDAPTLSLRLEDVGRSEPSLASICNLFDLSGLCTLSAQEERYLRDYDEPKWSDILWPLKKLKYVLVSGLSAAPFCRALGQPVSSRGRITEEQYELMKGTEDHIPAEDVLLPQLFSIDFYDVDFGTVYGYDTTLKPLITDLPIIFNWRKAVVGRPVQRLEIESCTIKAEWVDKLREVVSHVEWDRVEGREDDDDEYGDEEEEEVDSDELNI